MADAPQALTLKRNRDLVGRRYEYLGRWALLALLLAGTVLGLLNVFGQRPQHTKVSTAQAEVELGAPDRVRGGLLFEARITIHALEELRNARLVLDHGWTDGMTINTIEPSPVGEASAHGRLALDLGHIAAGDVYVLYLQFQVNPTNVGHRSADIRLEDGERHVLTVPHTITVFP